MKNMLPKVNKSEDTAPGLPVSVLLISVWVILISFGILTNLFPEFFEHFISPGRETEAKSYIEQADILFHQGQYHQAVTNYNVGLELEPEYGPAMINLGVTYLKLEQNNAARRWLTKAREHTKLNRGTLLYHLGLCHQNDSEWDTAIETFTAALNYEADNAMILHQISRCYKEKQQIDKQIEYLLAARKAFGNPLESYQRMFYSAEAVYSENDPENLIAIQEKLASGFTMSDLEPYDLVTFRNSRRLDPMGAIVSFELGMAYGSQNRYLAALKEFKTTVQFDPDHQAAEENIRRIETAINRQSR